MSFVRKGCLVFLHLAIAAAASVLGRTTDSSWITQLTSYIEPISDSVSRECSNHTLEYLVEMRNITTWAVSMMDATAKYPSGVLSGNIRSLGNFDQCLRVRHPRGKYEGKYCLLSLHYSTYGENEHTLEKIINLMTANRRQLETGNDWLKGTHILPTFSSSEWALCVPSSCTAKDVQSLGEVAMERAMSGFGVNISISLDERECYTATYQRSYGITDFVVMSIFAVLFLVIISSTLVCQMVSVEKKQRFLPRILSSFSLVDNWKRLVDMRTQSRDTITCLEGVRSLSTVWVVMTHQIILISQLPFSNKLETMETHNHYLYYPLWNSYFNVDTFLLVSGLLRSNSLMKQFSKGYMNVIRSGLQRYLRLTPTYLVVILFYMSSFDRLDSGPTWNYYVERNSEACRRFWWHNLLYINNYAPHNEKCMLQSWYLSADMQLFLIAPLLMYPLWRWRFVGGMIMTIALIISIVLPFLTTLLYKFPGTYVFSVRNSTLNKYAHSVYMATHNRMSPYFIGLCLGRIFHGGKTVDMAKWKVILGWTCSLVVMYATVYGAKGLTSIKHPYNLWEAAAYGGFHRFSWSTAVAWIIYACHTGYGGHINMFLSCNVFKFLGRLSYCVYLTHLAILLYNAAVLQTPRQLHTYITIRDFFGDFVFIFIVSLLLYICVELPFFNITKRVFR